ncbi:DinB family protein [Qingshengfaniella alkalisoli]|uniref:Damage-inducible protein DinB n=1 Tax=Qingshengfaniella alkalisoli TaxID=2599296 RepID=A0A5B8IUR7_9RHOB|nr:DinB family protein [Qingshengfaniella alkalisoli]QDY69173.1 damage-inducible protein DinB [Qingshengfaniella alkalisoli]
MITADYCRMMARYNDWQSRSQLTSAGALQQQDRDMDRGAFFGSITGTLNHLLWGDRMWMSRFSNVEKPGMPISASPEMTGSWEAYVAMRESTNQIILDWANKLTDAALGGDLHWYSGALKRDVTKPLAVCVVHFFNHQTHHRGQVHAMLTAAGLVPDDTDLFAMSETA